MTRTGDRFLGVALGAALLVAACGGSDPPSSPASATAGGVGGAGGSGGAGGALGAGGTGGAGGAGGGSDAWDPCPALTAPGAPPAKVVWRDEGQDTIDNIAGMAVDYGFPYAVVVPAGATMGYGVVLESCTERPGEAAQCSTTDLSVPARCGVGTIRWGVDSSQCLPGDNLFSFTLRLFHDTAIESESARSVLVRYAP